MTQEALKLALEALEHIANAIYVNSEQEATALKHAICAITAIKEALTEHAMREVQRLGQEIEQGKRGSIALARELCVQIAGYTDDDQDQCGHDYGSVDIAEILSAEVVRLQKALAQRTEQTSAERTLRHLGYTDCGGEYWKPPLGNPPQRTEQSGWRKVQIDDAEEEAWKKMEKKND